MSSHDERSAAHCSARARSRRLRGLSARWSLELLVADRVRCRRWESRRAVVVLDEVSLAAALLSPATSVASRSWRDGIESSKPGTVPSAAHAEIKSAGHSMRPSTSSSIVSWTKLLAMKPSGASCCVGCVSLTSTSRQKLQAEAQLHTSSEGKITPSVRLAMIPLASSSVKLPISKRSLVELTTTWLGTPRLVTGGSVVVGGTVG